MDHLKNILVGIGSVMNVFGSRRDYEVPKRGDRQRDLAAIIGDMKTVGDEMGKSIAKAHREFDGQSIHYRSRAR